MSDDGMEPYGAADEPPAGAGNRPRLIGVAAVLLAAGIGAGFGFGWASRGAPRPETSVASQPGNLVPSFAEGQIAAPMTTIVAPAAGGVSSWAGSGPSGISVEKAKLLGRWTTSDGIAVRAYRNDLGAPPGCGPSGLIIVELSDAEAVFQTDIPLYTLGNETTVLETGVWGLVEGAPAAWAVVHTAPGINRISVSIRGGGTDVVTPVGDIAVVASRLKSDPSGELMGTVTSSGSGGTTTLPLTAGPLNVEPACPPIPPTTVPLPPAGVQPADPVAARAAVTKAIGIVFGGVAAPDQFAYVEGATAPVKAAQKTAQDNNPTAHTSTVVQQIVFTSPTTASARYELFDNGNQVLNPISQLVLDGGVWKVTTASACAAYAMGGGHC